MKRFLVLFLLVFLQNTYSQQKLLIPMDLNSQTDHLRSYGIAYRHLLHGKELDWLLNYRGGSFMFDLPQSLQRNAGQRVLAMSFSQAPSRPRYILRLDAKNTWML
jgi:hypothetical protein